MSVLTAYAFEGEKRQHVFFRGADDHLHELAISIGDHAWGHYDLTAATGAPPMAGSPSGYAFEAEKRQHVLYTGADNHIHELAISIGDNAWGHYDLTAATGAPEPYTRFSGYAFEAEKRQHVFYTGTDDHIYELAISIGDNAWGCYDLTAATGAPLARNKGLLRGYPFETERRQHLLFFSRGDNHLHELAISIGDNAWGHYDLTLATSAPPPAPFPMPTAALPAGYAFEAEKRQHVVYTDGDNHIQELAISIGDQAWGHFDLTAATGAPAPLIGLVGYAFEAERRQHLVYLGADHHIHELAISMP
jgi:hypothetical protein